MGYTVHQMFVGRTGGRILSENMECQTGCLAVCLPERECDRTLSAGENRIRTGVFIRDRSADHNENGTVESLCQHIPSI